MAEVKVPLSTPIQAHGEEVKELTLRTPRGGEIRKCGFPMKADQQINTEVVANYIGLLAGIPPSAVDALEADDWMAAMTGVLGFFGKSPTTS